MPHTTHRRSTRPVLLDPRGSKVLDSLGTIADLTITNDGITEAMLMLDGHSLQGSHLPGHGLVSR